MISSNGRQPSINRQMIKRHLMSGAALLLGVLMPGLAVHGQGFPPKEAVARMKPADDVRIRLVASEPLVRQPVSISFDDRGRLWVLQYLQYPTPAGLKAVQVDRYLRTVYDKLPEPPPKGPKGADRLTILEDTNSDGLMDRSKDFITGLNLATGFLHGYGGVFVLQAPYLLFYADRNGDDEPDGDPEVLLTGFGMEDSHAYANSLTWGPDGWLYGAHGSTSTANIRGVQFQQGVWRYHPRRKIFELFAEGGGNTWGLDFDREGNAIAGTNLGGAAMLHQVQGGYYVKGFEKHGPLQNPHTYGYFEHAKHTGFFGGHVTCGGIVYQGVALPEQYRHQYIAANLLSNAVHWHRIQPMGSTFQNNRGGELLIANDTWFRPIDCETGPDGAVYVADWTDRRANHVDPRDDWDRTNGRIFAIEPKKHAPAPAIDLQQSSNADLARLWNHPNSWQRRKALRMLAERKATDAAPVFRAALALKQPTPTTEPTAIPPLDRHQALWFLQATGALNVADLLDALQSGDSLMQAWAVRFIVDDGRMTPALMKEIKRAAQAPNSGLRFRQQLACSLRRMPSDDDRAALLSTLARRAEDADDPFQPLLLWWAVESATTENPTKVVAMFSDESLLAAPIVQRTIIERLARRLAAGGDRERSEAAALYFQTPNDAVRTLIRAGISAAFEASPPARMPAPFAPLADELWKLGRPDLSDLCLLARIGFQPARLHLASTPTNREKPILERRAAVHLLGTLGDLSPPAALDGLLQLIADDLSQALHLDVVAALRRMNHPSIAPALLERLLRSQGALRNKCLETLAAKPTGARVLLDAVDKGRVKPTEASTDLLAGMLLFNDAAIRAMVEKHWGKIRPRSAGETAARIHGVKVSLKLAKPNLFHGKVLFEKNCGNCHQLFGVGAKIAPELTGIDRRNLDFLLSSIVDPSAVIRREYTAYTVVAVDGQVLTGLIAESTPDSWTLIDSKAQRIVLPKKEVEEMRPSASSLMPEKLLDGLTADEVRDLIGYLQSQPAKK